MPWRFHRPLRHHAWRVWLRLFHWKLYHFKRFLIAIIHFDLLLVLVACSQARPSVEMLSLTTEALKMKTQSPFQSENYGEVFRLAGECLSSVDAFQMQLDDWPWVEVPTTKPSPQAANEYLSIPDVYDVDCRDKSFDFYFYSSTLNQLYTNAGVSLPSPLNPLVIRLRGLAGETVVATITYEMPKAEVIHLIQTDHNPALVKGGPSRGIAVSFKDSNGAGTRPGVDLNLRAQLTTSGSQSLTLYLDSALTQPLSTGNFTVPANSGWLMLWIKQNDSAFISGQTATLSVSDSQGQMSSASLTWPVREGFDHRGQFFIPPQKVVKGLDYPLDVLLARFDYFPFSSAQLNPKISSDQSGPLFKQSPSSPDCDAGPVATLQCLLNFSGSPISSLGRRLLLHVPSDFQSSGFQVRLEDGGGASSPFLGEQIWISVDQVGGPTYVKPQLITWSKGMNTSECQFFQVGFANSEGTLLPTTNAKDLQISVTHGSLHELSDGACASGSDMSKTLSFSAGDSVKAFFLKAPSTLPSGGSLDVNLLDLTEGPNQTQSLWVK